MKTKKIRYSINSNTGVFSTNKQRTEYTVGIISDILHDFTLNYYYTKE